MSSTNYTFNDSEIEIVSGIARLRLPSSSGLIEENFVMEMNLLTSFAADYDADLVDTFIRFHLKLDGSYVYWNGSAWVSSDRSFAQSNLAATINTNVASLITDGEPHSVQWEAILVGDGVISPELYSVTVGYVHEPVITPVTGKCVVWNYLRDILGDDLPEGMVAEMVAVNDNPFNNGDFLVPRFTESVSYADNGEGLYAEMAISQTEDAGKKIRWMVIYRPHEIEQEIETVRLKAEIIPNQDSINLVALTSIDNNQVIS